MCGITGFIGNNNFISKEELIGMTDAISRRGPDAAGYFYQNSIALGHRRLSIIDLSDSANQPMESSCGKFVMVYNGEVYNFKEIALEIIAAKPDVKFKTSSDSEVILEAYVLWGARFVSRLNGMFAIAIYEKETNKLFICRDRLGIKPIYYFFNQGNFIFSSELKSISTYKSKLQLTVNKIAINEFLHLGYVPCPNTIYNEVKKFPTGNYAMVENGKLEFFTYWDLKQKIKKDILYDEGEAKQKLKELLISSVKYRMISDVPFGTFLSGGIDSSLVTSIAQSVSDEPVNTFSIGFETEKNEAGYAKKVAEHLGTNHHELYVTENDAINLIPDIVDLYDEPFADGSAVATQLVAKMARQNVTMTLSGDGGDELFMGYGAYNWATRLNDPTWFLTKGIISKILMYGNSRQKRVADVLQRVSARHLKSHIFSQEHYFFSRKELKLLLKEDAYAAFNLDEIYPAFSRDLSAAESQSLFDIDYYLKDDLLVKVDRATMKYSLETRVPILDYRIVEFAFNLSQNLKIKNGEQKYLLKQVLYDYVPKEFFERPKWGFGIPITQWLKGPLSYLIDDVLSEENINKHNVVNWEFVQQIIHKFRNGYDHYYNRIWALIQLHIWLNKNSN